MADFDIAATLVLKQEGGYSNNPNDPGGDTLYGISKRFYPNVDFSTLTPDGARGIYKSDYWETAWLDLPQNFANLMLSLSINMGKVAAVSLAQRALGVIIDGTWGHLTGSAALNTPEAVLLVAVQAIKKYQALSHPEFINGWIKRVLEALCA